MAHAGESSQAAQRPRSPIGRQSAWLWIVGLALLCTAQLVDDPDAFWHLATGRLALVEQSTLPTDPFSFTFVGQPWVGKDLFADLTLYSAFALAGWAGLAGWLAVVLAVGAGALSFRVRTSTWLLAAAAWLAATEITATPRSRIFSTALVPVLLTLLQLARERGGTLWLAAGGVVGGWLLLHRGGVVGLGLLGVTVVWQVWATRRHGRHRWAFPLAGVGLAVALGLLHPDGPRVWLTVANVAGSPEYRQWVSEFRPLSWRDAWQAFAPIVVLTTAAIAGAMWDLRDFRNSDAQWRAVMLVLALVLAGRTPRGMPLLAGVAVWVLLPHLNTVMGRWHRPRLRLVLAAATGLVLVLSQRTRPLGLGPAEGATATRAIAFAASHGLGKRVCNPLHMGGELLWSGFAPRIDGRNDQVYPVKFFVESAQATQDPAAWAAFLRRFPCDWALAANPGPGQSFAFLAQDPAWALVYWSPAASVFVPTAAHDDLPRLRHLDPADPVRSVLAAARNPESAEALADELTRVTAAHPDIAAPAVWSVMLLHLRGPALLAERDRALESLVARFPDAPEVRQFLQILVSDRGNQH